MEEPKSAMSKDKITTRLKIFASVSCDNAMSLEWVLRTRAKKRGRKLKAQGSRNRKEKVDCFQVSLLVKVESALSSLPEAGVWLDLVVTFLGIVEP